MILGFGWGNIYLIYSNVPLGTDAAWSASLRRAEGEEAHRDKERLNDSPDIKHLAGFQVAVVRDIGGGDPSFYYSFVSAPIWAICLPLAWISQRWIRRTLRLRHRVGQGLCLHCGYDLRGTPERCPECGRQVLTMHA
jgi:hypothetical protein